MSSAPDDSMLVTLRVGELRAMIREEIANVSKPSREPWVSVETAAKHCGKTPETIRAWIKQGAPASHLGRDYTLRLSELDKWLEEHRAQPKLKRAV